MGKDFEKFIQESIGRLEKYVKHYHFAGWDPFDGLNSTVFQLLPLVKNNKWVRLAWLQFFKRSPINFRPLLGVPKVENPKGLALFILGYAELYKQNPSSYYLAWIDDLSRRLIALQSKGYHGAGWGYPFDWQARAFFQPKFTPMSVSTAYAVEALLQASRILKNEQYKQTAISAASFILQDLRRTYDKDDNFIFSYSPLDHSQIYNAGLLAAKTLVLIWNETGKASLLDEALKVYRYVANRQHFDGSWTYGTLPHHQWIDNFHTGYNLEAYYILRNLTGIQEFDDVIHKGIAFYLQHFWTPEGIPKYYHNRIWPVDMHNPAQLVIVLSRAGLLGKKADLVKKVLTWSIQNMQAADGRFYYQKYRRFTNKIPYMRWTQAWMFYALAQPGLENL